MDRPLMAQVRLIVARFKPTGFLMFSIAYHLVVLCSFLTLTQLQPPAPSTSVAGQEKQDFSARESANGAPNNSPTKPLVTATSQTNAKETQWIDQDNGTDQQKQT